MGHIFISYKRLSEGALSPEASTVIAFLGRLGLNHWVDEHTVPGKKWFDEIAQRIAEADGFVGVITDLNRFSDEMLARVRECIRAKDSAADVEMNMLDGIDWIMLETEYAKQHGRRIVLLNASSKSPRELLPTEWAGIQIVDKVKFEEFEGFLSMSAGARFGILSAFVPINEKIAEARSRANIWAEQVLDGRQIYRPSILEDIQDWQTPRAVIGPPGIGKSILLAGYVKRLLREDAACVPYVVPPDAIDPANALASEFLQSKAIDANPVLEALCDHLQVRIAFIIDGLETMAISGAPADFVPRLAIERLRSASARERHQLLISCRDDSWQALQSDRLGVKLPEIVLKELSNSELNLVDSTGQLLEVVEANGTDLLRIPLYAELYVRGMIGSLPTPVTSTRILNKVSSNLAGTHEDAARHKLRIGEFLNRLAEKQLARRAFLVPQREFEGYSAEAAFLLGKLYLDDRWGSYRFRHDELDSHNVARYCVERGIGNATDWASQLPIEWIDRAVNATNMLGQLLEWSLSDRILKHVAHILTDRGDESSARRLVRIFNQMMWYLDRKPWGEGKAFGNVTWNVTRALQWDVRVYKELILQTLEAGFPAQELNQNEPLSAVGVCASQASASTLWSVFAFCDPVLDDVDIARILRGVDSRYKLRWKLYSALAKHSSALGHDFLKKEIARPSSDVKGLISAITSESGILDKGELLRTLRESPDAPTDRYTTVMIDRAISHTNGVQQDNRSFSEFFSDLKTTDTLPGTGEVVYSEWKLVESAAEELIRRVNDGEEIPESVLDALGRAGGHFHDQTRARIAADLYSLYVRRQWKPALAYLAGIFLNSKSGEQAFSESFAYCKEGLRRFPAAMTPALMQVNYVAHRKGLAEHTASLTELLETVSPTRNAMLLKEFRVPSHQFRIHLTEPPATYRLTNSMLTGFGALEPSPDFEVKYGVVQHDETGATLAPVSWQTVTGLFNYVSRIRNEDSKEMLRSLLELTAMVDASMNSLPGIAVAHIIVTTEDNLVLTCRTTDGLHTASLQEQINEIDLSADDPIDSVVRRGIFEELNAQDLELSSFVIGSAFELSILNIAFLIEARFAGTGNELLAKLSTSSEIDLFELCSKASLAERLSNPQLRVHDTALLRLGRVA